MLVLKRPPGWSGIVSGRNQVGLDDCRDAGANFAYARENVIICHHRAWIRPSLLLDLVEAITGRGLGGLDLEPVLLGGGLRV